MPEVIEKLPKRLREKWDSLARTVFRTSFPKGTPQPGQDSVLIVGYSGGPDSTALLFACAHLRDNWVRLAGGECAPRIIAAHFNHGLRDASGEEEIRCKIIAVDTGGEFVSEKMAAANSSAGGVETAARIERIAFLKRTASRIAAHFGKPEGATADTMHCAVFAVLLAHTMDDQAETLIMNLARGTGVKGAAGMPAQSLLGYYGCDTGDENAEKLPENAMLLRPFLKTSKKDIVSLLEDSGIEFAVDPTNLDSAHTARNRVRNEILPLLSQTFPAAAEKLARFAEIMGETDSEVEACSAEFLERCERPFHCLFPGVFIPGAPLFCDSFLPKHALRYLSSPVRARVIGGWIDAGSAIRADYTLIKRIEDAIFSDQPCTIDTLIETSSEYMWRPREISAGAHPVFSGEPFGEEKSGADVAFYEAGDESVIAKILHSAEELDEKLMLPQNIRAEIGDSNEYRSLRDLIVAGRRFAVAAPLAEAKFPLAFKNCGDEKIQADCTGARKIPVRKYYERYGIPPGVIRRILVLTDAKGRVIWYPRVSENPIADTIEEIENSPETLVLIFTGVESRHL